MEVACSLEDVARVLADNGYNLNDDSCFANAADLPSVLSALDSPDSFPESPCSDEDIARVLDIARMPSPSLLDSCTPNTNPFSTHNYHHNHHNHNNHHNHHNHHNQLPITPTEGHAPYEVSIHKTKDPCITNAVLQTPLLPSFNPVREHQSLDLFSIALNCSFHDDNAPVFNTLVSSKDNDAFNNYFNSSSALSPVSETDTILPGSCDLISKNLTPHPALNQTVDPYPSTNSSFDQLPENKTKTTTSDHLPPSTDTTPSINLTQNQIISSNTSSEEHKPQIKRKRRKKSSQVTPKSKRRKQQDKSNVTPDLKPETSPKQKVTKPKLSQTTPKTSATSSTGVETNTKRKCSNSNSGPKKPRKSKNCNISTLETISESSTEIGVDINNNVSLGNQSSAGLDPATEGIGSTNGVTDEPKGPRRSSRSTRNTENYNFRLSSLVKRVETERKQQEPKQPKGKVKPPPLSKYRRRTANARERDRMKEINDAFDVLKNTLPDMEPEEGKSKITKFTILKLALNYISSLQDMLGLDPSQPNTEYIGDIISSSKQLDGECTASFSDNSSNINDDIIPTHGQPSENDNNAMTTNQESPTSICGMKVDQTSEHLGL